MDGGATCPEALGAFSRAEHAYRAAAAPESLAAVLEADRCEVLLLAGLVAGSPDRGPERPCATMAADGRPGLPGRVPACCWPAPCSRRSARRCRQRAGLRRRRGLPCRRTSAMGGPGRVRSPSRPRSWGKKPASGRRPVLSAAPGAWRRQLERQGWTVEAAHVRTFRRPGGPGLGPARAGPGRTCRRRSRPDAGVPPTCGPNRGMPAPCSGSRREIAGRPSRRCPGACGWSTSTWRPWGRPNCGRAPPATGRIWLASAPAWPSSSDIRPSSCAGRSGGGPARFAIRRSARLTTISWLVSWPTCATSGSSFARPRWSVAATERLERQAISIEAAIRRRLLEVRGDPVTSRRLNTTELRRRFDDRVLVEYVDLDGRLYAVTVTRVPVPALRTRTARSDRP